MGNETRNLYESAGSLKKLARRVGIVSLARSLRRAVVTRREPQRVWEQGRARELAFWERVLPGRLAPGGAYASGPGGNGRADLKAPVLDPTMAAVIDRVPDEVVSILDVGAGPLTVVGKTYPGKRLQITATDPLAEDYDQIMREIEFEPPIRTLSVSGEDLLDHFGPGSFDIAFARNSIDHAADPVRLIRNMLAVVKPGRFVLLWHLPAQGERWRYHGLHQWNFALEQEALVIRRPRRDTVRIDSSFDSAAAAECFERDGWIGCLLTRAVD